MSPPPTPTSVSDTFSQLSPDSASHHGKRNQLITDGLFIEFSFSNIGIKFAGLHIAVSSWQMLFVRCLGQSVGMLPLVWWSRSVTQALLLTPDCAPGPPSSPRQTSPPGGGSQRRPWWAASCSSPYSRLSRGCP